MMKSNKIPPNIGVLEGIGLKKRVYKVCVTCVVNYGGIIAYGE
jgi:hypothetical protein